MAETPAQKPTADALRQQRLAAALRANLSRRKARARADQNPDQNPDSPPGPQDEG